MNWQIEIMVLTSRQPRSSEQTERSTSRYWQRLLLRFVLLL